MCTVFQGGSPNCIYKFFIFSIPGSELNSLKRKRLTPDLYLIDQKELHVDQIDLKYTA